MVFAEPSAHQTSDAAKWVSLAQPTLNPFELVLMGFPIIEVSCSFLVPLEAQPVTKLLGSHRKDLSFSQFSVPSNKTNSWGKGSWQVPELWRGDWETAFMFQKVRPRAKCTKNQKQHFEKNIIQHCGKCWKELWKTPSGQKPTVKGVPFFEALALFLEGALHCQDHRSGEQQNFKKHQKTKKSTRRFRKPLDQMPFDSVVIAKPCARPQLSNFDKVGSSIKCLYEYAFQKIAFPFCQCVQHIRSNSNHFSILIVGLLARKIFATVGCGFVVWLYARASERSIFGIAKVSGRCIWNTGEYWWDIAGFSVLFSSSYLQHEMAKLIRANPFLSFFVALQLVGYGLVFLCQHYVKSLANAQGSMVNFRLSFISHQNDGTSAEASAKTIYRLRIYFLAYGQIMPNLPISIGWMTEHTRLFQNITTGPCLEPNIFFWSDEWEAWSKRLSWPINKLPGLMSRWITYGQVLSLDESRFRVLDCFKHF